MPTFLVERKNIAGDVALLSGAEAGHMLRSLRLSVGDTFHAFDEEGTRYRMRILEATSRSLRAEVLEMFEPEPAPSVAVTLLVGLPKADKMDFILEKATELGVSRVIPFRSSRAIPRVDPLDAKKRLLRWERVALAAAKQCGSGRMPEISGIVSYNEALLRAAAYDEKVIFYEGERNFSLKSILSGMRGMKNIALLVGPEGGFSPAEVRDAVKAGCRLAGLGSRILRVETAALAVLSMAMYHFE
ncbi:MAG: 16S rRNA (uracil(1498)-N(3))-methyltransferase [Syntrophorhabdaceae bacterium]|nr:16S rRNA (uracil(1498)-N(3))-methyltransferase [Syntrophorhabdaceae bacterium]